MTRQEEIRQAAAKYAAKEYRQQSEEDKKLAIADFTAGAEWADQNPKSPWITDRMPEIKGAASDAVLLLLDGMFYKVSRLGRREDGSEFWWGVDPEFGEEVQAWMPIPELPNEGEL